MGEFDSDRLPAFVEGIGVYLQSGTLRGVNVADQNVMWSFAGDGDLTSAPLIVKDTIYIGASSGLLYALNFQGHQIWSTQVVHLIGGNDTIRQRAFPVVIWRSNQSQRQTIPMALGYCSAAQNGTIL